MEPRGRNGEGRGQYRVGARVSYELDLFGRIRNANRAAVEAYLASAEAHRATHLALVGEVATQYLRERAFEEQRVLAERTLAVVTQSLEMSKRLLDAGQRSDLDVSTADA